MVWIPIFNLACVFVFTVVLTYAALQDVKNYKIPNMASLALILLFIPFAVTAPVEIAVLEHLAVAGAALLVGFLLFAVKVFGAGDAKMITGIMLWAGLAVALDAFIVMAIAGGVIAIGVMLVAKLGPSFGYLMPVPLSKVKIPYGVAICCGGYAVALHHVQPLLTKGVL